MRRLFKIFGYYILIDISREIPRGCRFDASATKAAKRLIKLVSAHTGIPLSKIRTNHKPGSRDLDRAYARKLSCFFIERYSGLTQQETAKFLGLVNHSTVIHHRDDVLAKIDIKNDKYVSDVWRIKYDYDGKAFMRRTDFDKNW